MQKTIGIKNRKGSVVSNKPPATGTLFSHEKSRILILVVEINLFRKRSNSECEQIALDRVQGRNTSPKMMHSKSQVIIHIYFIYIFSLIEVEYSNKKENQSG